ncbi:carboxypeptidase regulatory-like domain-containing protein [Pyxidicoccus xibeiensis]|uniref:carboxypeptidase regulatory-like domain-containing protein n=1 Tax=Pyxidicoccus xibeiensis TaxID=2906759 RepID=UPI0020A74CCB|nr:carboxypeptidase regulatory-like domain-containing protein [Pyxidicoccus xibeiensis]MCP3145289.1 carboxypeptidase regulatory-like domain-containing protein [Pyxidicoccus xibeiensis]
MPAAHTASASLGASGSGQESSTGSGPHSPSTLGHALVDARNLRLASSTVGGVGLLRVAGADLGRTGLLRFGLMGEYFTNAQFPVQGAENTRTAGTFSLAYVPLDFLELSLAYRASSNTNSRSSPNVIQALGDVSVGARATREWVPGLWAGVDLRAMTFSTGDISVERPALGIAPRLVSTYDLRPKGLPLRAHANLGVVLDGAGDPPEDGPQLNASEEFALGFNRYHRLSVGVGVEAPLPGVTPFLEYGLAYPLGVDGVLVAPDGQTLSAGSAAPQVIGLGARVTAVRDLTLTAAAEFGMHRRVGLGVATTPPFNLFVGASYTVDVLGRTTPAVLEKVPERPAVAPAPRLARVEGVVVDARTRQPLPGVIVAVVGASLPPVATAQDTGRFLTHEVAGGPVKLSVRKEGYRTAERELVLQPGERATVEVALQAEVRPARFAFAVTSRKRPVGATITLRGAGEPRKVEVTELGGPVRLDVPAGRYGVDVAAPGHLAQTRELEVAEGAGAELSFDLEPEPKKRLVTVKNDQLELGQPVRFTGETSTVLHPDSLPLLAEVVDAIVRGGITKVRVEGHTDNQGDAEANLRLSRERARAVAAHLVKAGLDAARVEAEGYGGTRPVAPNLTPKGRELNRRVDIVIPGR